MISSRFGSKNTRESSEEGRRVVSEELGNRFRGKWLVHDSLLVAGVSNAEAIATGGEAEEHESGPRGDCDRECCE